MKKGPYGRCVYHCDNDVVDHQVVNLEFENGVTASFTMCAFTQECERVISLMGTRGQIKGNMEQGSIEILDFVSGISTRLQLNTSTKGHSGSDVHMMRDILHQLSTASADTARTTAAMSVESHLMALTAEESRVSGEMRSL